MLQTSWKRWLASPWRVIQPLHWESTKAPQEVMMGLPQPPKSQGLRSKRCGWNQVCDFLRSTLIFPFCCQLAKPFVEQLVLGQLLGPGLSAGLILAVGSLLALAATLYLRWEAPPNLITFITWPANNVTITHPLGTGQATKRMNFRKNSKQPLTPPLIFGKLYCNFFAKRPKKSLYKGPKSVI